MSDHVVRLLGLVAGLLTAISLVPQIVKIVKDKKAQDISVFYLLLLLLGLVLWIIYGVLRKDIPVIATNVLSVVFNITTIVLGLKYKKHSRV